MRLKASTTTSNGILLTTTKVSAIMINPPTTAEEIQLYKWYNENKDELKHLLNNKPYGDSDLLLPRPQENDIVAIVAAIDILKTVHDYIANRYG
ncbi:hypothetical protein L2E82_51962 [Cichorium intybus]|nr:hypothetical protein L2E82_51962 [Cichorium intybus]